MTEQPMKLALSLDKVDEMSADAVKVEEIRKAYENSPSLLQEYEKAGYKSDSPFMQQIRDVLFLLGQVDKQSSLVLRLENVCGDLREELDMQREEAETLAADVARLREERDAAIVRALHHERLVIAEEIEAAYQALIAPEIDERVGIERARCMVLMQELRNTLFERNAQPPQPPGEGEATDSTPATGEGER